MIEFAVPIEVEYNECHETVRRVSVFDGLTEYDCCCGFKCHVKSGYNAGDYVTVACTDDVIIDGQRWHDWCDKNHKDTFSGCKEFILEMARIAMETATIVDPDADFLEDDMCTL